MINNVTQQGFQPQAIKSQASVGRAGGDQQQVRDSFSKDDQAKDLGLIPKPTKALHGAGTEILAMIGLAILAASAVAGGVVGGVAAHMLVGTTLATWLGVGGGAVAGAGIAWKAMS